MSTFYHTLVENPLKGSELKLMKKYVEIVNIVKLYYLMKKQKYQDITTEKNQ